MTILDSSVELVADSEEIAVLRELDARHQRNSLWLQSHWSDFIPSARGKFVAVADEAGFIAETAEEAWAWVGMRHPNDNGAIVRHIREQEGPRIYGHRG